MFHRHAGVVNPAGLAAGSVFNILPVFVTDSPPANKCSGVCAATGASKGLGMLKWCLIVAQVVS